jgi:hypothetical protein
MKNDQPQPLTRESLVSQKDQEHHNVVNNITTRKRYEATLGFPAGFLISPGARRWTWGEVLDWIEMRRRASAGQKHKPPAPAAHIGREIARERAERRRAITAAKIGQNRRRKAHAKRAAESTATADR